MYLLNNHISNLPDYLDLLCYYIIDEVTKYIIVYDKNEKTYILCEISEYMICNELEKSNYYKSYDTFVISKCGIIINQICYHKDNIRYVKLQTENYGDILRHKPKETPEIIKNYTYRAKPLF